MAGLWLMAIEGPAHMRQRYSIEDECNVRQALLTQIFVPRPARTSKEFVLRQYGYIVGARRAGISWSTIAESIRQTGQEIAVTTLKRYCTANRGLLKRPEIQRAIKRTIKEKQRLDVKSQLDPGFIAAMLREPAKSPSEPLPAAVAAVPPPPVQKPVKLGRKLITLAREAEHEPSRKAQFKPVPPRLSYPLEVRPDGRVYYSDTGHPFLGELCAADVAELIHTGKLSARKST